MRRSLSVGLSLLVALLLAPLTAQATYTTPTVVSLGTVQSNAAAITVTLPTSMRVNDVMFMFCETENQAISIATQNGGAWAEVSGSPIGVGTASASDAVRLTMFWDRYNGTQTAPVTSDSGDHQMCRIIAIRGVPTSGNPWNAVATGTTETPADTSWSHPGATPTVANTLVIIAGAGSLPDAADTANEFTGMTNADLTGLTEQGDHTTAAGTGGSLFIGTGIRAAASAYGATTQTSTTSAVKAMFSMAIAGRDLGTGSHVQSTKTAAAGSASSIAVAFTSNNTAGNLLVAAAVWGTADQTPTIIDTQGNTWTEVGTHCWTATEGLILWYAANSAAGANTVTVNFGTAADFRALIIGEYSGMATANPLDVSATNCTASNNTTVDHLTSTAATTTVANDLVVGATVDVASLTPGLSPGTGYTERQDTQDGTNAPLELEDAVMVTAGGIDAYWTSGAASSYHGKLAAFKPAGGAVAVPTRMLFGVGQ